ncbi:MAG: hypothetical protein Ct9H300mP6_00820 [Gammaproteobacteria bacterium]|nr:MAG: hypothetical protein Ct9H300mP6_00820 [Gammaproteobacteria bacterium]
MGDHNLTSMHFITPEAWVLLMLWAPIEGGITTLDSSLGGIGGCPFAPGASGNIVTEDLVFMLDSMGLKTGINIEALIEVNKTVKTFLPNEELYGFTIDSGLPKGYSKGDGALID